MILPVFISALAGYLLGSINTSLVVGKLFYNTDVREHGSGNAGATNTLRTLGKSAAVLVILGDLLKGIAACLVGRFLTRDLDTGNGQYLGEYLAGFSAVLGHNWPVYFGFKGGKGVMTSFAVIVMFSPGIALACLGFFIVIVAFTRYVSLGSMICAALFPVMAYFMGKHWSLVTVGTLMAILIIVRHRANIQRLLAGNEKKLSFKKKASQA
jgi:glycerol-3-phosphate acyltransferase PlsY